MYILKDLRKKKVIDRILEENYNSTSVKPAVSKARPVDVRPLTGSDAGGLEVISSSLPDRGLVSFDPLRGTFREVK